MERIYYKRDVEKEIGTALKQFPVILITGPRQSGKSTLLRESFKNINYINLELPNIRSLAQNDPELFLSNYSKPLIIDEIQYAPELLFYIKSIVDNDRFNYGQYILTGSQSFQLMHGISESLAGRVAIFNLLPFSWNEVRNIPQYNGPRELINDNILTERIIKGFYPEFFVNKNIDPELWFSSYITTYLERDVRNIKKISDLSRFQTFINLLSTRVGSIVNMQEIAKECGITQPTVKDWLSILESTYVIYLLRPYYKNITKRVVKSPKLYFIDTGLLCYLLGIDNQPRLFKSKEVGHIFENMIIIDFIKKIYSSHKRQNIYFYRTKGGLEIDLLIERNEEFYAYEIKFSKTINKKMVLNLINFCTEYQCTNAKLVSLQPEEIIFAKNVKTIHWSKVLL